MALCAMTGDVQPCQSYLIAAKYNVLSEDIKTGSVVYLSSPDVQTNINDIEAYSKLNKDICKDANSFNIVNRDSEKPYRCDICGKGFVSKNGLAGHLHLHSSVKPYTCIICLKSFTQAGSLKTHQRLHSGVKPHSCETCGKGFAQLGNLKTHQRTHAGKLHSQPKYHSHVPLPTKNPSSEDGASEHHECLLCHEVFTSPSLLKNHQVTHTGMRLYTCQECNASFSGLDELRNHRLVHYDSIPQVAEGLDCGTPSGSDSVANLLRYRIYRCDVCFMIFSSDEELKQHKVVHFGNDAKPHECKICQKKFIDPQNLKNHERVHAYDTTLHACDQCSKTFTHLDYLEKHRIHNHSDTAIIFQSLKQEYENDMSSDPYKSIDDKHFLCDICHQAFRTDLELKDHHLIHAEEYLKPHACDVCHKRFFDPANLERHSRIHSESDTLEKCDKCNKTFTHVDYLKAHMEHSHASLITVKSFSCDVCDKQFARKSDLTKHQRLHNAWLPTFDLPTPMTPVIENVNNITK